MITAKEQASYHHLTSGLRNLMPVMQRNGLGITADRMRQLMLTVEEQFPWCRDNEALNETGCCCGEIRGNRNRRKLCEACEVRAGNGGSL